MGAWSDATRSTFAAPKTVSRPSGPNATLCASSPRLATAKIMVMLKEGRSCGRTVSSLCWGFAGLRLSNGFPVELRSRPKAKTIELFSYGCTATFTPSGRPALANFSTPALSTPNRESSELADSLTIGDDGGGDWGGEGGL